MKKEVFIQLIDSYIEGKATAKEKRLVETYYQKLLENGNAKFSFRNEEKFEKQIFEQILQEIQIPLPPKITRFSLWSRMVAAASVVLVAGLGIYFYQFQVSPKPLIDANDAKPGGNKAVLTLSNGRKISLNDVANGELLIEGGVSINKTADGELIYKTSSVQVKNHETLFNTIETPRGGQYQVHLPDGTQVWLNAASKLKYPVNFTRAERRVELSGEAYFEVAKDKKHPFIVKNKGQEVKVLGTHFNINDYAGETSIKTTLLEGTVKVTGNEGSNVILKPGKQSILKAGTFEIKQADLESDLAWRNGYFSFDNESIQNVMKVLARWYDIEVNYQGDITNDGFNGKFSRYNNISQVLKVLEKTGLVHFKIEGRRVLITN